MLLATRVHRMLNRAVPTTLLLFASLVISARADAQTPVRVRVTRATVVLEQARGDSVVLARVPAGTDLEYLQQYGRWVQVAPLAGAPAPARADAAAGRPWRRGWILVNDLTFLDPQPGVVAAPRGEFMIRGFGQFGVTLFTARDSFEAIFDSRLGSLFGGGVQVLLTNGLFVQGSIDRFEKTGQRVVVSGPQVFRLTTENTVRISPLQATIGFREARANNAIGYLGGGVGLHVLEESSPALAETLRQEHIGFHVLGGAEYRLAPFIWIAGEAQWTAVPNGLAAPGIGPAFDETDLGGTSFRVKVLIGR